MTGAPATMALKIESLWCELLSPASPLKPTDNFFALGGDSLSMMLLLFRIKEELGIELPPGVLLESPQLAAFCARSHSFAASE